MTSRSTAFGLAEQRILGDGVVTGHGTIDGRLVFVFSQDFTVFGGSLAEAYAEKIVKVMDLAMKVGAPIIGLNDSGGARIQEGVVSLGGYADIFLRNTLASGVVPQLSVIMGPCAGGAVYSPAITDFTVMVEGTSYMFVTGPNVVKAVTHEDVDAERLGGATTHTDAQRRRAPRGAPTRRPRWTSRARSSRYLPQNNLEPRPISRRRGSARSRGPATGLDRPGRPVAALRHARRHRGASWTTASSSRSSRTGRRTSSSGSRGSAAAASASSPSSRPSSPARSTSTRSSKAARFVRTCDCFNVPLVTFVDVPGFLPGVGQEHGGIIRHGAKLLFAYCEATVPKVTVITRKAYGGAYDVMSSKHVRGDMNFAWPTAEIAVMGVEGAVNIIFRDRIADGRRPERGARSAGRRVRGGVRQPVCGGGSRLRRRGDPARPRRAGG